MAVNWVMPYMPRLETVKRESLWSACGLCFSGQLSGGRCNLCRGFGIRAIHGSGVKTVFCGNGNGHVCRMKLMNIVAHQIYIDPRFFHQRLRNAPNDQIIDGYLGIGRFIQLSAMRQQSVEFVFGSRIKVGNGLLGFGEPPRNGLAGSSERDHVDTRRRATAATGGCFNILIGNAPPAPCTGDGARKSTPNSSANRRTLGEERV